MSGQYKLKWLCEALLVSRSGYYDWLRRRHTPGPRQRENTALRQRIREVFLLSRQTYGSPRLARGRGPTSRCAFVSGRSSPAVEALMEAHG